MRTTIEAPILLTARLRLRMLQASDFEEYAAMHADPEVTRFTARAPLSRSQAWDHMARFIGHWHIRGFGLWAVEDLASGRLAGRVGFHQPEGWPGFELAWTIGREFWGRGYATEAAARALQFGFNELGRDHIISLIDPENTASIRVAERLGETLEGEAVVNGYKLRVYGIRSPA